MSLFGGITDWLTGGANDQAEEALNQAEAAYSQVQAPTQQQLSLPELQSYVDAGLMTPAQMQAYLQQSNAYSTENIPQSGTAAQVAALNQLAGIANAGAAGTPVEQAQIAQAIQQENETVGGEEGAIQQQMEAKGVPAGMIQAALETQDVGQAAEQAYQSDLQAQANAYQTALSAMSGEANVGSNLQSQENTQANTVAAAQNAMEAFNASQQQQAASTNAQLQQQANEYNTQEEQAVSNANTQEQNARTAYNTQQAQTAFQDAMSKAAGEAGVNEQQASNYMQQGQENAGTASGIIGTLSDIGNTALLANSLNSVAPTAASASGPISTGAPAAAIATAAKGGIVGNHEFCYHDGGICMEGGGMVPGKAKVPGNSLKNDKVHIMASPGEAVIPRTAVAQHMPEVLGLIASGRGTPQANSAPHPHDIASLLQAMKELRMGVA